MIHSNQYKTQTVQEIYHKPKADNLTLQISDVLSYSVPKCPFQNRVVKW